MSDDSARTGPRPIVPSDWAMLSPLLNRVLDAPSEERAALLDAVSAGDGARRARLAQLVEECELGMPLLDAQAVDRFDALTADSDAPLLPEVLADRYRVGKELGRGGMARVYLARDAKHGRDVAIKVIRPEFAISLGNDRFRREIEIAARLRHPNIVPLYDSGEAGGALYFVMPFEDGPSLREQLHDHGALPIADALSILRDVARALAHAHAHGVVHRDVKPDNVMLSGGAAVVTDFGIAKAVSVALTGAGAPSLTQTGSGIGTPAYMAPEQATGDPSTDHRADVYSFGCLAFELFTGHPPFPESSAHMIVAAHMTKVPPRVSALRPEVPESVADIVARCLAKSPDDRPQQVNEILGVLHSSAISAPRASADARTLPPVRARSVGIGARAAIVTAGLAALAYAGYFAARPRESASTPLTLAVLPFGNTAADTAMEFVVESLADEVAASLMQVPGIQIKSRAGARMYRGQLGVDVEEAGRRLKAEYLMTGVVRQDHGRWLLSTDLARASDGASVWTDVIAVDPEEQAGAVDRIGRSLLTALRTQFPNVVGAASASATAGMTSDNDAYRLFLRGQESLSRRGLSVRSSAGLFRQAIHADTTFARAYSGLSMALVLSPYFHSVTAESVNDEVVATARRALELAPGLAQPHIALGMAHQFAFRWDSAAGEFRTAIERDGRDVEARVQYARHLLFRARHNEALQQLRVARAEDPASALVLSWMAYAYYVSGQQDSAEVESERALENDSLNLTSLTLGALIKLRSGRLNDVRRLSSRVPPTTPVSPYLIAQTGDTARIRRYVADIDDRAPMLPQLESTRGMAYLALGDTARALTAFERALARREFLPLFYAYDDPIFDAVLSSARYRDMLRRIGLNPDDAEPRPRR